MTLPNLETLQNLFREAEVGWFAEQDDEAAWARHLHREVQAVEERYDELLGRPVTPSLWERFCGETERWLPLIQTLAAPLTRDMRLMVLLLLEGADLEHLRVDYQREQSIVIEAKLQLYNHITAQQDTLELRSEEVWDMEVVRHLGLMKLGGRPLLQGYFAFRSAS